MQNDFDLAIIGSGFSGSLLAMIARRLGLRVALVEKGRHPRFAIGESSTPLANLLLEELATRYDLPRLLPLCKWGTWQREYPEIACGLKRGFSFLHHTAGREFSGARHNTLMVGASPHDGIADTHWYRPDFDQFLAGEAARLGAEYIDEFSIEAPVFEDGITLRGTRQGQEITLRARFLVDATGPRGYLHRALNLSEELLPGLPSTQALFSHFQEVNRLGGIEPFDKDETPYPVDDAALHHVFDGGWIWVLRFNNGLTSAGIAARDDLANELRFSEGETAWRRLLARFPTIAAQFKDAKATLPFMHAPRLSFCSAQMAGENWAMLPSAAGFVDPLLSSGFPLTLLGITRLADFLETDLNTSNQSKALQDYAAQTRREVQITARLVGTFYRQMHDFEKFAALSLLYFAAASYSETARRLKRANLSDGFLMHDHPTFGPALNNCLSNGASREQILQAIAPIDVAGLTRLDCDNWYPVNADDLRDAAHKVNATTAEIDELLHACGFEG